MCETRQGYSFRDNAGAVTVIDTKTLAFLAYDGTAMCLSVDNINDIAKIGILFID